jgi:putative cardiolipin synthase
MSRSFRRLLPLKQAGLLCLSLFLAACGSLPTDVERTASYALPDSSGTRLAEGLQPLFEQNPGLSGFHTLSEGEAAFAARLQIVEAADRTIDTQYYIWHDDLTGRVLHNRLLAAADRGVRVRMLLDDLDTAGKDELLRKIDAHPNIEIRLFNPFANRDTRGADFITDTRRVNHRMHNKTLTADNLATIFGGRNIGDEYFAAATDLGFGDLDALAVGPIAREVSSQFDLYWNSEQVYPLSSFDWDEPISPEAVNAFRKESEAHRQQALSSEYAAVVRQFDTAQAKQVSDLSFVWSDWALVYDQPNKLKNDEISEDTHLAPRLLKGMDKTRTDLIIVSPYFVPGDKLTHYLTGLVDRGVRVRILTNSLQANDVSLVHAGYMRYREDLVSGGVELYEYKADANKVRRAEEKKRKKENTKQRIGSSRASLHAKFFVFDGQYLFIGSFNLDPRSIKINTELGAYFKSPQEAGEMSEIFDERAIRVAYRVNLNEEGNLEWVTLKDGQEIRLDKEPDTTAWKRFSTKVLSVIVPESQL